MNTTRREVMKGIGALATLAVAPSESLLAQCVDPGTTNTGSTWWGSGHIMTSLGNTTLISGRIVTQAFRAKKTGSIRSVIWYNIHSTSAPGYSAGTGGNIRVRIEGSDASGHANGTPLGGSDTLTNAATAPSFPKQVLSSPAPVEAGKIYHVTFYNTHSDPSSNYVSTDCINIKSTLNVSPHNPQIPDIEDSVYYKNSGGSWIKRSQTPILDLEYTDGFHQGTPYMTRGQRQRQRADRSSSPTAIHRGRSFPPATAATLGQPHSEGKRGRCGGIESPCPGLNETLGRGRFPVVSSQNGANL